jgi:hypothetical protein
MALARWFQYAGDMAQAQASKRRAVECLDGVTRRERQHVTALAREAFSRPGLTFADMHCALAYAAAGDQAALESLAEQLEERLSAGKIAAGEVVRVGGSNAQRSVFEDTLLHAYLRGGRHASAEALLRQRLARRPSAQDERWLQRAQG